MDWQVLYIPMYAFLAAAVASQLWVILMVSSRDLCQFLPTRYPFVVFDSVRQYSRSSVERACFGLSCSASSSGPALALHSHTPNTQASPCCSQSAARAYLFTLAWSGDGSILLPAHFKSLATWYVFDIAVASRHDSTEPRSVGSGLSVNNGGVTHCIAHDSCVSPRLGRWPRWML